MATTSSPSSSSISTSCAAAGSAMDAGCGESSEISEGKKATEQAWMASASKCERETPAPPGAIYARGNRNFLDLRVRESLPIHAGFLTHNDRIAPIPLLWAHGEYRRSLNRHTLSLRVTTIAPPRGWPLRLSPFAFCSRAKGCVA
jgi:hypothetical protein